MKKFLVTIAAFTFFTVGSSGQNQVTICHFPPGNPQAAHTITVGAPALKAHLAHGDIEESCEALGGSPVSLMVFGGLLLGWAAFKLRKSSIFG